MERETEAQNAALTPLNPGSEAALSNALRLWGEAVTAGTTERRDEILSYKQRGVESFFASSGKHPIGTRAGAVEEWRPQLAGQGLKPTPIYTRVCFLSSFFRWAMRDPALKEYLPSNPARLALPKAPKAYQTESVKAW